MYQLYSVVVNSGYSSDGGHYNTWASSSSSSSTTWLLLNDGLVTETTRDTFYKETSKLSAKTAYLLFYKRTGLKQEEEREPPRNKMDRVISDNMKYLREKESGATGIKKRFW